jgi:hypothetical protein
MSWFSFIAHVLQRENNSVCSVPLQLQHLEHCLVHNTGVFLDCAGEWRIPQLGLGTLSLADAGLVLCKAIVSKHPSLLYENLLRVLRKECLMVLNKLLLNSPLGGWRCTLP